MYKIQCRQKEDVERNIKQNQAQKQKVILTLTTFNDLATTQVRNASLKLNSNIILNQTQKANQSIQRHSCCQHRDEPNNEIVSLAHIQSEINISINNTNNSKKQDNQSRENTEIINDSILDNPNTDKIDSLLHPQNNDIIQDYNCPNIVETKVQVFRQLNEQNVRDRGKLEDEYKQVDSKKQNRLDNFETPKPNKIKGNKQLHLPQISSLSYYNQLQQEQQPINEASTIKQGQSDSKNKYYNKSLQISPNRERRTPLNMNSNQKTNRTNSIEKSQKDKKEIEESLYSNKKLKAIILHNYLGKMQNEQFLLPKQNQQILLPKQDKDVQLDSFQKNQKAKMTYLNNIYTRIKTENNEVVRQFYDESTDQFREQQINNNNKSICLDNKKRRKYSLQMTDGLGKYNYLSIGKQTTIRSTSKNPSPTYKISAFDSSINANIDIETIHQKNIHKKLKKISDKLHSTKTNVLYIIHPNSFYIH